MGGGGVLYLIIYSIVENVPRGTYYFGCGVGIITSPSSRFTFILVIVWWGVDVCATSLRGKFVHISIVTTL